jgi:hypothetical protein
LITSTTNAYVQHNSLTHVLWVDNRRVMGAFDYFMNSSGVQSQFYQDSSDTPFYVGFQAYHTVMCDLSPSPVPSASFMSSFDLSWQEGLNGTSGWLAQGEDTNWTSGCTVGVANAYSTASGVCIYRSLGKLRGNAGLRDRLFLCPYARGLSDAPPTPPCPPILAGKTDAKTL